MDRPRPAAVRVGTCVWARRNVTPSNSSPSTLGLLRCLVSKVGAELNEVEANYRVLAEAKRLNLSSETIAGVQGQYNVHYNRVLGYANQISSKAAEIYRTRMDQHIFSLAQPYY
jgi:hypothetical protein